MTARAVVAPSRWQPYSSVMRRRSRPPPQAPSSADASPVAVGPDWRYEKRGADVHTRISGTSRASTRISMAPSPGRP
jgi:hypothetical protein